MKRKDIFTSIIRVKGNDKYKVVPIKSSEPVEISLWVELSKVLSRIYINTPIKSGDVICKNVLNTGMDIVCTRTLDNQL